MSSKASLIKPIVDRLAELEQERYTTDIQDKRYDAINVEMSWLRLKLQDTMNCPVVKGDRHVKT